MIYVNVSCRMNVRITVQPVPFGREFFFFSWFSLSFQEVLMSHLVHLFGERERESEQKIRFSGALLSLISPKLEFKLMPSTMHRPLNLRKIVVSHHMKDSFSLTHSVSLNADVDGINEFDFCRGKFIRAVCYMDVRELFSRNEKSLGIISRVKLK